MRLPTRRVPITDYEAERLFEALMAQGFTRDGLLATRAAWLDRIAPGMTRWLRDQAPGYLRSKQPREPDNWSEALRLGGD